MIIGMWVLRIDKKQEVHSMGMIVYDQAKKEDKVQNYKDMRLKL